MPRPVLITVDVEARLAQRILAAAGVASEVVVQSCTTPEEVLSSTDKSPRGPDVVLVGRAVEAPIALAQQLLDRAAHVAIVVVAEPDQRGKIEAAVRKAPLLEGAVTVAELEPGDSLAAAVAKGVQTAGDRRRRAAMRSFAAKSIGGGTKVPRASAALLSQVMASAPMGLIALDAGGRIVMWNPAAAGIFGAPERQALGRVFTEFLGDEAAALLDEERPARGSTDTFEERIASHQDEAGTTRWLMLHQAPLNAESGARRLVIVQDVTEREEAKKQVESLVQDLERRVADRTRALERRARELDLSNQALEQFANVASHDLKEPLRIVASFVQLLERRYADQLDDKGRRYIDQAVRGTRRMGELIDDILAYSRAGGEHDLQPVELETVVQETLDDLALLIEENGAKVHVASGAPRVRGAASQIGLALQNMLTNAIKFRRPGTTPEVWVEWDTDEAEAVISVRDNGIGIDPQYHEHIFGLFRRLHSMEEYPGTGLGLAIIKRVVDAHGGRVWIESAPDEGTTVFLTLPLAAKSKDS